MEQLGAAMALRDTGEYGWRASPFGEKAVVSLLRSMLRASGIKAEVTPHKRYS